jgi:tetratricopeptide (TPR) repeat protein
MKIALPTLRTSHLITNEEATRSCQIALEHKDREDYKGAQKAMRRLWSDIGARPETKGLHVSVEAEVLLCAGILTGWIGSKNQIKTAQETAKDLISESINYFGSIGDQRRVAAARVELAFCYYREGELNESRIMIREALEKLTKEGNTRARALLKLVAVEIDAARFHEAFRILSENVNLFLRLRHHTIKGGYHNEMALILRHLAKSEKRDDYITQAITEFQMADQEFKLARNRVYRSDVKNNVGLILFNLSRYKEAHKYLDEARRLSVGFRDQLRIAQINESEAQVFIAEGKFKEAEAVSQRAVFALEKSGHHCLLTEALITQGIALARSGRSERAHFIFQQAIQAAVQVNAVNMAGLAALTLIEEVDIDPLTFQAVYQQAREWLANSERQDVLRRLSDAAGKLVETLAGEIKTDKANELIFTKPFDLQEMMLKHEGALIKKALVQANGSVTHAASLLGVSYQALCYMIEGRHKNLLKERSPIRRRTPKAR